MSTSPAITTPEARPASELTPRPPRAGESGRAPGPGFRDLFEEHLPYVLRTLRRLGARDRDADDLAQEVFLVVFRRLSELDLSRSLKPYLFRTAHNLVRAHRRRGVEKTSSTASELDDERLGKSDPNVRALIAADVVHQALDTLDDDHRAVFVLLDIDGVSASDAASLLGMSERTVYNRLRSARDQFTSAARRLLPEVA